MGIFDSIKNAIWGDDEASAAPTTPADKPAIIASAAPGRPADKPTVTGAAGAPSGAQAVAVTTASGAAPAYIPAAKEKTVDVAAMLDAAQKRSGENLDWRRSIVDLMKALNLDSSLANRKNLARELNYTGDTSDSATMNIWLHKALMRKLSENGGQVPTELTD